MRFFSVSSRLAQGLLFCSVALSGCDTSTFPDGVVATVTSPGDDPWTGPPAATHARLDVVTDTSRTTIADVSAPPGPVSLGNDGPNDIIAHFEMTGLSDAGDPLVFGASAAFLVRSYAGAYVPLFVARKGGFATAPNALLAPHIHPLAATYTNFYSLIAGGTDTSIDFFDAGTWGAPLNTTPLPQTVKSFAIALIPATTTSASHTLLLLINDDGANWQDIDTGAVSAVSSAPLAFKEIVGGQTLMAGDGTSYIVGATRTDSAATNKVLRIDTDGTLHAVLLNTPRLGAAATLVEGALLVTGGSAKGAGAELIATDRNSFDELPFPADETTGGSVAELSSLSAVLAGGHDASGAPSATRTLDLGCASDCSATELPKLSLDVSRTNAFNVAENRALIVGESDDTQTHAYLFDASGDEPSLVEQDLRTPRSQASAVLQPNYQVGIFGGTELSSGNPALNVDVFFP